MTVTSRLNLPLPQPSDAMNVNPPAFATIWSNVDAAIGPTICTSSTRPGSPYACQWIYQTDNNLHLIWDPVASAWVQISTNPTEIIGINNSTNNTSISATATRYLCTSINGLTVEQNRNYRIHVEGVFGYTATGASNAQPTETASVAIHVATAGSITTGSSIQQQQYCDAWCAPTSSPGGTLPAQNNFAFDAVWNSGSGTYLSAGWSVNVAGSFNPTGSAFYVQNSLTYVERC